MRAAQLAGPTSDDARDIQRLVGMLERIKRQVGPAFGIVDRTVTGSQRATYRRWLQEVYDRAKAIQDDLTRGT